MPRAKEAIATTARAGDLRRPRTAWRSSVHRDGISIRDVSQDGNVQPTASFLSYVSRKLKQDAGPRQTCIRLSLSKQSKLRERWTNRRPSHSQPYATGCHRLGDAKEPARSDTGPFRD